LAVVLAIAASRHLWRPFAVLLAAFTVVIIPYLVYSLTHPSGLLHRFKNITYVFDDDVGLLHKLSLFIENYSSHFGLKFLLLHGDSNLRHATGQGGEVFFSVFFLAALAIGWLILHGRWRKETFMLSLCGGLIIAPIAAALTNAGIPHAFRSSLMGLFLLLLSCEGLRVLLRVVPSPRILIVSVLGILALESAIYLRGYFTDYVPKSREAFGNYGVEESILRALAWGPSAITTDGIFTNFYKIALPNPKRIPIDPGPMTPGPGRCLVYNLKLWPSLAASTIPSVDLSVSGSVVGVRCFNR
jgi:hypothetical protein